MNAATDERKRKYDEAERRWTAKPDIPPCEHQEWRLEGRHYQEQLFCTRHRKYVNPNGHTCDLCRKGAFPRKSPPRDDALLLPPELGVVETDDGVFVETSERRGERAVYEKTRPPTRVVVWLEGKEPHRVSWVSGQTWRSEAGDIVLSREDDQWFLKVRRGKGDELMLGPRGANPFGRYETEDEKAALNGKDDVDAAAVR